MRKAVDQHYAEGVQKYQDKQLMPGLSREHEIGNYVDQQSRQDIRRLYDRLNISYGKGKNYYN